MVYDWSGEVDASLEKGQPTGLQLKKGDVISVVAHGWVKYDPSETTWAAPQGCVNGVPAGLTLVAVISGNIYQIGNGVLHWSVPVDGELNFLFADQNGAFSNNSGSFTVNVVKEKMVDITANQSHEKKGIQSDNKFTFQLPAGQQFGVTTLVNTGSAITVNIYSEDNPELLLCTQNGTGTPNITLSNICKAGSTGKIKVEILSNGKPVKSTKFAYHIFDALPGLAVFAAEDGTDNDFNDAIVMLNWPLG